jgi:hypothetical protein
MNERVENVDAWRDRANDVYTSDCQRVVFIARFLS